ncbi:Rho termination factor N-terminal domain-containing protein [Pseudomonas sp. TH05]|uniref:Rho termination factor N-terminal domain-containing protein n=1 Tax=unclassified Pseudomonas TaxID=196821 RepID=UPI000998B1E6|nr:MULTISPECIES: Rho termination factor N-terminal domain-containing protein [unclassified Pseudomonas]MBK5539988.1 Rho termination factor N-terminal domain-containing protein [Pseudomonas sp. TH07]MBK5559342.1 Rho termination factor N-terminal domain-containing protein [Pseudomonas sp. TH05]OOV95503.1 termination factor Rho [Pseudomonas sp. MF4836]
MIRASKSKYSAAQKRKAAHIEASYEAKGLPEAEAEARAWATVNKQSGGGERAGGSGRHKPESAKASDRQASARRAVATRQGHARNSAPSLATQSKEALLKEARARNIPGRSTMRKQELIEALRKAG